MSTLGHPLRRAREYLRFERVAGGYPALDGLRGVAILLVLLRHGVRAVPGGDSVVPLFTNGWAGVDLFFVLSGFLVFRALLRRWSVPVSGAQVGEYVRKRVLRIVPAYFACVFFFAWWYGRSSFELVYHLMFLQDVLPAGIVVAFWSLGVEEKFYLLAPFVATALVGVRDRRVGLVVLLALALSFAACRVLLWSAAPVYDYDAWFPTFRSPFYVCFDALFLGAACAWIHARWPSPSRTVRSLLVVVGLSAAAALLAPTVLLDPITTFDVTLQPTLLALSFAALLLGVLGRDGMFVGLLSSRPLFVLSKLSYSLYLVHMSFMGPVWSWLVDLWPGVATGHPALALAAYLPPYLAVSIVAALLLHYTVEKPGLLWKDRPHAAEVARTHPST